jgi:hypothetical protein
VHLVQVMIVHMPVAHVSIAQILAGFALNLTLSMAVAFRCRLLSPFPELGVHLKVLGTVVDQNPSCEQHTTGGAD